MALKFATTFKTLSLDTAYLRIIEVKLDCSLQEACITYQIWSSEQHRNTLGATPLELRQTTFLYSENTGDIIPWAYTQLKSLAPYVEASDVMEEKHTLILTKGLSPLPKEVAATLDLWTQEKEDALTKLHSEAANLKK